MNGFEEAQQMKQDAEWRELLARVFGTDYTVQSVNDERALSNCLQAAKEAVRDELIKHRPCTNRDLSWFAYCVCGAKILSWEAWEVHIRALDLSKIPAGGGK